MIDGGNATSFLSASKSAVPAARGFTAFTSTLHNYFVFSDPITLIFSTPHNLNQTRGAVCCLMSLACQSPSPLPSPPLPSPSPPSLLPTSACCEAQPSVAVCPCCGVGMCCGGDPCPRGPHALPVGLPARAACANQWVVCLVLWLPACHPGVVSAVMAVTM